MAFAPLTYRESLRDIEAALSAQSAKLYHMGLREPLRRATLADANKTRDWRIYAEIWLIRPTAIAAAPNWPFWTECCPHWQKFFASFKKEELPMGCRGGSGLVLPPYFGPCNKRRKSLSGDNIK
jgi:hypothetical protein